jgi:hypothetical protein
MAIHLRSYHRKVRKFKHPLLDGAKPVTEERAAELAEAYLKDRSKINRDALVLSMLSMLRYIVGRYIANFPQTRAYLDDMVSEGLLTIVKSVDNLNSETLQGRNVIKVVSQRVVKYIEIMLYDSGSIASPDMRTSERHKLQGKETPYLIAESNLTNVEALDSTSQEDQDLIDAEDALSVMAARLQLDADLLKSEYRHLTAEEAGARLGVHHSTILRRRAKLRSLYKVDFGG